MAEGRASEGGRCGESLARLAGLVEKELGVKGVVREVSGTPTFSVIVQLDGGKGVVGVACTEEAGMAASAAVQVEGGLRPEVLEWALAYNYRAPGCWMLVEEGGSKALTYVVNPADPWSVEEALRAFVSAVKAVMDLSQGPLRGG